MARSSEPMKKAVANDLVALFVLMIISSGAGVGKTRTVPDDVAETVGEIVGELMLFAGLYYSTRWNIKLSGHTYKIDRQTVATILFWYSLFALFVGLMTPLYERN